MAAGEEFKGNGVVATFDATDISATVTMVNINEEATEPAEIDITHGGATPDTTKQSLEGLPGQPKGRITMKCWDETGGSANIWTFEIGDSGDFVEYPEGQGLGKRTRTVTGAKLIRRSHPVEVEAAVYWEAEFSFIGKVAEGTQAA